MAKKNVINSFNTSQQQQDDLRKYCNKKDISVSALLRGLLIEKKIIKAG